MCIGVSTPPLLLCQAPLLYWVFVTPPPPLTLVFHELPPKNWISQWTFIIVIFFILNPIPTFQNFPVCLVIKCFRFQFTFYGKTAPPLKKVTPLFPATPISILRCHATPFWKFVRRLSRPPTPFPSGKRERG